MPSPTEATLAAPSPIAQTVLSPVPTATPTAVPTVTVDEFLRRMSVYWSGPAFRELPVLPASARDDPLFGVNDALKEENWTAPLLQGSGAALDRVEIRWDEVEPAPGEFQFGRLDHVLHDGVQWHLSVLAVVDGAPAWAVDRPERAGSGPPIGLDAPPLLANGEPNPQNPWAVFLSTVARRYGDQVGAWEIWNEPNLPEFWRGTPADYALLLQDARTTLRFSAPRAPVLVAGMVEDDGRFLGQVMPRLCPRSACAASPFDGVAWHIYNDPIGLPRVAAQTRALLAPYQLDPAIWITEANVPIDDPKSPPSAFVGADSASLTQQAAFVLQIYALARAADVHTVAIYRASDIGEDGHYWGLLRGDISARPSIFAYRTAATWLSHAQFVEMTHPTAATTWIKLRRAGQEIHVLWTTANQPATIRIPSAATDAQIVDLTGNAQSIHSTNGTFTITLPAAPADRRPKTAPLAAPVILVVPTNSELQ